MSNKYIIYYNLTTSGDILSIDSSDIVSSAKFVDKKLIITMDKFTADLRLLYDNPPEPEINISWTVKHNNNLPSNTIDLKPEADLFDFALTVGVGEEKGPLVGSERFTHTYVIR